MVIRFPLQYISIILGSFICIYALFLCENQHNVDVSTYEPPLSVLIIDPGHGGADGGAVNANGVQESTINLAIALKLNSLCHLYGISTVMTRDSEDLDYPENADTIAKMKVADQQARLRRIQDFPQGILFSIHQNFFPTALPNGVQVFYGHSEESRELGVLMQERLRNILCPDSRRVAAEIDNKIYLLKNCNCTAVLIECGFLSNPKEAELLQTENYQRKIASILVSGYLEYTAAQMK